MVEQQEKKKKKVSKTHAELVRKKYALTIQCISLQNSLKKV